MLRLTLKTQFAEESGIRTTKRDALQYAESVDAPAYEDGPAVADTVPDKGAALAFAEVEYGDFLDYCRRIIGAALDGLSPAQAAIVRQHYPSCSGWVGFMRTVPESEIAPLKRKRPELPAVAALTSVAHVGKGMTPPASKGPSEGL